ncbi:MAG: L-histidine N(alpha)-methyltransferase [Okeania sp. SIO2D1]|nr:L-histidine N(alpha)-methyltransferase [Okeania sp. SIO2D1]
MPEISVEKINTDFIKNIDLIKNFTKPVVFFKGSTITNLSTNNCLKFFERISPPLQPDGILIVGVDSNQNESSLKGAYDDGKMANLTLSILYFINRDLPVSGFDPTAFNYEFNWVAETHCVEHNVRATKDQDFILDGVPINIKSGTKFHFLSSYKYPVDYFQELAIKSGLKPLDYFVHQNEPMVIHVLGVKN